MGTLMLIKSTNLTHIKWPCTCEPKRINWFSLRQNLRLLLTLFESIAKPHIIIIFHLKTHRQKLEKYNVNGSQIRIQFNKNSTHMLTDSNDYTMKLHTAG